MGFQPGTLLRVKNWNILGPSYACLHRLGRHNLGTILVWNGGPPIMYVGCSKLGDVHQMHFFLHGAEVYKIILANHHDIHYYFEVFTWSST